MKRFGGLMPSDEIELSKRFKTSKGDTIQIDTCKHGWTVIWGGIGSYVTYRDIEGTAESNLQDALDEIKQEGVVLNFDEPPDESPGEC